MTRRVTTTEAVREGVRLTIGGIAVARIAQAAALGQVLVSSTVKDLIAGSGLEFRERGTAELKGVPGDWRLIPVESGQADVTSRAPSTRSVARRPHRRDAAAAGRGAETGVGSARVKAILVVLGCALAATLVGCGGGDDGDAAPLSLEQRILRESDAPGSKPDPVERRETFRSVEEAVADPEGIGARIGRAKLEEIGFVAAIHDTRFWPTRPGGTHTRGARHVRMFVIEVRDEERAQEAVELLRAEAVQPCPGECAVRNEEFEPSSVPDAHGLHRFARAEEIEAIGDEGEPFDAFLLWFADGPFAYEVEVFANQGTVSQEQVEEIAERVHRRVKGAPSPG